MSPKSPCGKANHRARNSALVKTLSRGRSEYLFVASAGLLSISPSRIAQFRKLVSVLRVLFACTGEPVMRASCAAIARRSTLLIGKECSGARLTRRCRSRWRRVEGRTRVRCDCKNGLTAAPKVSAARASLSAFAAAGSCPSRTLACSSLAIARALAASIAEALPRVIRLVLPAKSYWKTQLRAPLLRMRMPKPPMSESKWVISDLPRGRCRLVRLVLVRRTKHSWVAGVGQGQVDTLAKVAQAGPQDHWYLRFLQGLWPALASRGLPDNVLGTPGRRFKSCCPDHVF